MSEPSPPAGPPPRPEARPCPICGRPSVPAFRPFCSRACRGRDLLAWLGGHYAVPAVDAQEEEGPPPEQQR